MSDVATLAIAVFCAIFAGCFMTWTARALAWHIGLVNHPNPIVPQHTKPVAYLGGLGIAVGALTGVGVWLVLGGTGIDGITRSHAGFALGCCGFLALGLYDDARPLGPAAKFALQIAIAVLVIRTMAVEPSMPAMVAGAVWVVVLVNAFNLTDVCDGMVGLLSVPSLVCVTVVHPSSAVPALTLAGAISGFLWFNRPPASIFLGDAGSHFLGFAIAALWLPSFATGPDWGIMASALLGNAVFLFELGFLVVVRALRGVPFWRGTSDHFSLRLQALGLTKPRTVAVASVVAALYGALAICQRRMNNLVAAAIFVAASLGLLICALLLLFLEHRRAPRSTYGDGERPAHTPAGSRERRVLRNS